MSSAATIPAIDVAKLREEFPILHQKVNGRDLVYFDNAATTQKPKQVIQALVDYYQGYNANIHRGIHTLAEKATRAFEDTREAAAAFVNSKSKEEIIFLSRGVTEGVNLVADMSYWESVGLHNEIPFEQSIMETIWYIDQLPDAHLRNAMRFYGKSV